MLDLPEPLRRLLPQRGEQPATSTVATDVPEEELEAPWQWTDAGGLYVGNDGAWLYRELPTTVLMAGPDGRLPLSQLLTLLSEELPGREVHLVSHTWEQTAEPPAGIPGELATYLAEALNFLVPVRSLLLGIRLEAAVSPDDGKLRKILPGVLAHVLGEAVPEFSRYNADRAKLDALLAGWVSGAPSRAAVDYLESWYTLGNGPDLRVYETQDVLNVGSTGAIEMVAVMGFTDPAQALTTTLPNPGAGSATVVSVRGKLTDKARAHSSTHMRAGTLHETSLVVGRRVMQAVNSWVDAMRSQPGIELRPLPLRQLSALDETLPCSQRRVSPTLSAVDATLLSRVGVHEVSAAGDPTGTYLGLVDPNLAHPCYLNPLNGGALTLVTGEPGSGKTFLAESLAVQAGLAGCDVVYLTSRAQQPSALLDLVGGYAVTLGRPGDLDPFTHADPPRAAEMAAAVLPALIPDLTPAERAALDEALRRAVVTGARSLQDCLEVVTEPSAVARLRRAQRRSPYLPLLSADEQRVLPQPPASVIDLSWLTGDRRDGPEAGQAGQPRDAQTAALVDLAVACVLEWARRNGSPRGTLVIVDDAEHLLDGTLTMSTLVRLRANQDLRVHTLVLTSATARAATSPLALGAERAVVLAETDPVAAAAAQRIVGLEPDDARAEWLAEAHPVIEDGHLYRPALGLHRDARGRQTSLLVGPVPRSALATLARGSLTT